MLGIILVESSTSLLWAFLSIADLAIFYAIQPMLSTCTRAWEKISQCRVVESSPRVLVLGSSFAGLVVRSELGSSFDITLVDRKGYFEYTPGVLRCAVNAAHGKKLCCELPVPSKGQLMIGEIVGIAESSARVRVNAMQVPKEIPFDYCVIALGSAYRSPWKPSEERTIKDRMRTWEEEAARLRAAESLLILGGGLVGVELAGEVLARYPEKRVTLVARSQRLCQELPAAAGDYVRGWLEKRGARLVLGQDIRRFDAHACELGGGATLTADIVYPCLGARPNGGALRGDLGHVTDPVGAIRVLDSLQVEGRPRVFAVGDVMRHGGGEALTGYTAEQTARLAAHNIRRLAAGRGVERYPEGLVGAGGQVPGIFCVSLGPHDGVVVFNWLVMTGPLAGVVKWMVEWTKVAAVRRGGGGVGGLFWAAADASALALSRLIRPAGPSAAPLPQL